MPFNFTPLEYNQFQVTNPVQPPRPSDYFDGEYDSEYISARQDLPRQLENQRNSQFRGYGQNQFQSLFDAVNKIGASPFTSGDAFYNTPQYEAVSRDLYTTQSPATRVDYVDDRGRSQYRMEPGSTAFDQQGYNTARIDNMANYMTDLGGFFRNLGTSPQQIAAQQVVANAPFQNQSHVPLPAVGGGANYQGTAGGVHPFGQVQVTGGGWGTPGAGYGLLGGGE